MNLALRKSITSCAVSLAVLVVAAPASFAENPVCDHGQSPRDVDPNAEPSLYALTAHVSFVGHAHADSLTYLPRAGGPPLTLVRCGQHYHFPIENHQGCDGEWAASEAAMESDGAVPPPGSWVEVHTVYAAKRRPPDECDSETLSCCKEGPFLVRAFNARVTAEGGGGAIIPPSGRPLAEWSGSTTGPDTEPNQCKPPAMWSFRLGCHFTVSAAQLARFKHADPARPLQTGDRLSRDLTLVEP